MPRGVKRSPSLVIMTNPDPMDSTSFTKHFLMVRPEPIYRSTFFDNKGQRYYFKFVEEYPSFLTLKSKPFNPYQTTVARLDKAGFKLWK